MRHVLCLAVVLFLGGCTGPSDPASTPADKSASPAPSDTTASAEHGNTQTTAPTEPPPTIVTADEVADGWVALFDGQTRFGWQADGAATWQVNAKDNSLVAEGTKPYDIFTTCTPKDYELSLDFQADEDALGAVLLAAGPTRKSAAQDYYEIRLGNGDGNTPAGSLVARANSTGSPSAATWNHMQIKHVSGAISVVVNDTTLLQYTDSAPPIRGSIGLRFSRGRIAVHNIKFRPLKLAALFNGKDLSGWKTYPEMPSRFTVSPAGELHVENGRGQLETEHAYGDFVLQLDCITHAPNLNSGVFFRCIPGEQMNGYESQIHNGFKNGDRTQPADCGTGGIFHQVNARRVVANDLEWFHKTLMVDGPHVAVWVNGYQVTDWTDERTPNKNPRRGLRLEPGTLMIQGHDPTTDISFRNLRIAEWPRDAQ